MYTPAQILNYKEEKQGTYLTIFLPGLRLGRMITRKLMQHLEVHFDDGRHISAEQRRKAYATIRDIADYTGYLPEEQKEWMKWLHMEQTGDGQFSLSNCSMDTAREFINTILEYAIENGIPLSESALERTDDIEKYLYYCIIHRKCAVCGRNGEIHHVDAIGMGNDRRKVDDQGYRKICLCRLHHTIAHQKGAIEFCKSYKVYGITVNDFEHDTACAVS